MDNVIDRLLGAFTWGDRFRSAISVRGRLIFLGNFDTAEAAHKAYMSAKAIHHTEAISRATGEQA
jgi:hypothetical protein